MAVSTQPESERHTPAGQIHPPASPRLRWARRFPGTAEQPARARHWIQALLPPCPARDDLITVTSELASNAVRHTRSQAPGGTFGVTVSWNPDLVRLVVSDQGSPAPPVLVTGSDGTSGLGLVLVSKLARQWGVTGGEDGRNVWADLPQDHGADPVPAVLDVLHHQYPGARAWYGEHTGRWWAAPPQGPDADALISAESPGQLNDLLAERSPRLCP